MQIIIGSWMPVQNNIQIKWSFQSPQLGKFVIHKYSFPSWLIRKPQFKAGYGTYSIESVVPSNYSEPVAPQVHVQTVETVPVPTSTVGVNVLDENISVIPSIMDNYVPFGHFKDLKSILKSGIFFPVFITGLSGNGKTLMVEQICAKLKKELFRVNITIETDEDDLIGSNTLINGNIVFKEAFPVLKSNEKRCSVTS